MDFVSRASLDSIGSECFVKLTRKSLTPVTATCPSAPSPCYLLPTVCQSYLVLCHSRRDPKPTRKVRAAQKLEKATLPAVPGPSSQGLPSTAPQPRKRYRCRQPWKNAILLNGMGLPSSGRFDLNGLGGKMSSMSWCIHLSHLPALKNSTSKGRIESCIVPQNWEATHPQTFL